MVNVELIRLFGYAKCKKVEIPRILYDFVIIINKGQIYSGWLLNLFVDCGLFQNQTCLFLCHCSLAINVSTWSWLVASALAFFAFQGFWLCLSYFSLLLALQLLSVRGWNVNENVNANFFFFFFSIFCSAKDLFGSWVLVVGSIQ